MKTDLNGGRAGSRTRSDPPRRGAASFNKRFVAVVLVRQALALPKIFEKDGYKFFFYSNEHRPIHVHVRHGGGEAVFEVEQGVELRESQGLKLRQLAKAEALAEEHRELIIQRWHEHLDR